jgi:hypothetical protein
MWGGAPPTPPLAPPPLALLVEEGAAGVCGTGAAFGGPPAATALGVGATLDEEEED